MKIAIAGAGSRGDIQPIAGLAVELVHRGHDVRLICEARFADLVEGRGVELRAASAMRAPSWSAPPSCSKRATIR